MPYIKQADRPIYYPVIEQVLHSVTKYEDPFDQVDYIGYFLFGVSVGFYWSDTEGFSWSDIATCNVFSNTCQDEETRTIMNQQITSALGYFNKDLRVRSGELNYLSSAIIWGYLGDCEDFKSAKYATRAYMRGALLRIIDFIEQYTPSGKDRCRSHTLLRGVLGDIMEELYRRRTGEYEDIKIKESGDIWPLRK